MGWSELQLLAGYLALGAVLSDDHLHSYPVACCLPKDSQQSQRGGFVSDWPRLAAGEILATVGISHLTTSRQHLVDPVLRATPDSGGYRLDGFAPG